jgi:hypothetical protein
MRRILFGVLAAAAVAACGSSTDAGFDTFAGDYALVSINGHLPPVVDSAGNHVEAASLTLRPDGTYAFNESVSLTGVTTNGTYVRSGNNLTFTPTTTAAHAATGVMVKTTFLSLSFHVAGEGVFILTKNLN